MPDVPEVSLEVREKFLLGMLLARVDILVGWAQGILPRLGTKEHNCDPNIKALLETLAGLYNDPNAGEPVGWSWSDRYFVTKPREEE